MESVNSHGKLATTCLCNVVLTGPANHTLLAVSVVIPLTCRHATKTPQSTSTNCFASYLIQLLELRQCKVLL